MGIFSRLAQLIKSNLNDLISRSEDPEKMLNQVMLEMSTQLVEAKKQVATTIADERRLAKQLELEKTNASEWERRAMLAIRSGDEALAKEALGRKKEHETLAASYQEQWEKQKASVEQLKKALHVLNDKIEEAKRKKNVLIARKKRADAQKSIQTTMSGLSNTSAFDTFERMANKVDQLEAEAEAHEEIAGEYTGDTLASKFTALEQGASAEDELAALKRKMGLIPQEAPPRIEETEIKTRVSEQEELAEALDTIERQESVQRRKVER